MEVANPLAVFLAKSGSKGDRLLFRYPYGTDEKTESGSRRSFKKNNPYMLIVTEDPLASTKGGPLGDHDDRSLMGFPDKVLSNLFAVKPELCGQKFELKVNNIRFVGHPALLHHDSSREQQSTILMFNIVFALSANASHTIVNCYYNFSHRLAIALEYEERRCGYISSQAKLMLGAHDEVAAMPEGYADTPYHLILSRSELARNLQTAFEDLKNCGSVHLRVNKWIEVSFCLPHKVHQMHNKELAIEPAAIQKCLTALRPYHAMLLLVDSNELLESLPQDASPALIRVVKVASPLKSLNHLACDADITLTQVFQIVGHLIYWAKATIIYPLCESNVYIISPNAPTQLNHPLMEKCIERFPGTTSLLATMSQFSLPTSLSQLGSPMNLPHEKMQQVQTVAWMLQQRLLMQLHTYVYLVCTANPPSLLRARHPLDISQCSSGEDQQTAGGTVTRSDIGSPLPSDDSLLASPPTSDFLEMQYKSGSDEDVSLEISRGGTLPSDLTAAEKEAIMKVPAASNTEDLKLFSRLCHYFRGRHHLEEIMYYENVRRSTLLALIDKFRDVLITCQHEDEAVAAFYNSQT